MERSAIRYPDFASFPRWSAEGAETGGAARTVAGCLTLIRQEAGRSRFR